MDFYRTIQRYFPDDGALHVYLLFLTYFPYFEKEKYAYALTMLSVYPPCQLLNG
jgi:hypothetical protein